MKPINLTISAFGPYKDKVTIDFTKLGENGILGVVFNDYQIAEIICSTSLIFIMFFGGFGTNLSVAKPVIVKSIILSSFGVLLTALIVAGFVYYVLDLY